MFRFLRFAVILVTYVLLVGLVGFLAFGYVGAGIIVCGLSLALIIYFYFANNLITGFFRSKKLSEVFHSEIYSSCRNEFYRQGIEAPQLYQYVSSESNSVLVSSIFGSTHVLLSSELVKSTKENIRTHFVYAVVKQKFFPSSRVESLVGSFGLINIHILNFISYPFTLVGKTFELNFLLNIRELLMFLFVPLFGIVKRFILGKNKNIDVYKKMIKVNISEAELVDSIIKTNSSLTSNLFELDLIEYNKFLSVNFNIEESELAF